MQQLIEPATAVEPKEKNSTTSHIQPLTGIRFIAALLVYLSHLPVRDAGLPQPVKDFFSAGFNGVTLFFILSGFVLTLNYYDRLKVNPKQAVKPYFVARFARIYPIYLVAFLLVLPFSNFNWLLMVQHITMLQAWNPNRLEAFDYVSQSWSVSVEAFFYLCFPVIVLWVLPKFKTVPSLISFGSVIWLLTFALAAFLTLTGQTDIHGPAHYWVYHLPATRLADFLLGCIIGRIFMILPPVQSVKEQKLAAVVLAVALVAVVGLMMANLKELVPFRYDSAYSLFFAVIIFCLARYRSVLARLLALPPLVLLGEASYSFYLIHLQIISGAANLVNEPWVKGLGTVVYIITLPVAVLVSILAFKFIETPARKRLIKFFR